MQIRLVKVNVSFFIIFHMHIAQIVQTFFLVYHKKNTTNFTCPLALLWDRNKKHQKLSSCPRPKLTAIITSPLLWPKKNVLLHSHLFGLKLIYKKYPCLRPIGPQCAWVFTSRTALGSLCFSKMSHACAWMYIRSKNQFPSAFQPTLFLQDKKTVAKELKRRCLNYLEYL